jgi:hypothetical protein
MSKLRFYAKDDGEESHRMYVPSSVRMHRQLPQIIGRTTVIVDGKITHPATTEPWECDAESADAAEILNRFRRGKRPLWPADAETALACGVEFVKVTVKDGVAVPVVEAKPATSPSSKARASAGSDS